MAAFALTDVQIAPASPLGLVIKTANDVNTTAANAANEITNLQWVINIGGIGLNSYTTGVQVPVSVVIFGVAGGYLRFLYYTSTKKQDIADSVSSQSSDGTHTINGEKTLEDEPEPFYESLKDLSLFFLSPLLAIAVWLVLTQAGYY